MGDTRPYYRKSLPKPQRESDFARPISLKQVVKRLRDRGSLPQGETIRIKDLYQTFQTVVPGSIQSLLLKMLAVAGDSLHIDLVNSHLEPYNVSNPVTEANQLFDKRTAAAVFAAVSLHRGVKVYPNVKWKSILDIFPNLPYHVDDDTGVVSSTAGKGLFSDRDLLEMKFYGDAAPTIYVVRAKCLAAMAYADYFPQVNAKYLWNMVSEAVLAAQPGWCGTFGPDVDAEMESEGGDYDMNQMYLLSLIYRYYDELSSEAREHLIRQLLARGVIVRPYLDPIFTSGGPPNDWNRAGRWDPLGGGRIGETENHILMIHTVRYLTNQLLYQRDHDLSQDNRRNGSDDSPSCTELMLILLHNILRDDFSEYNAKPYQTMTRSALLNLCSYAYDHEVRLAARMVLDYISAHIAVSSNDLRRMVPFRRRNENDHGRAKLLPGGFMDVGLLDWDLGADPLTENFAIQSGNIRAYEKANAYRPFDWSIASDGVDSTLEALSDYRLPPSIHDLIVNDLHRRFFQRLHRTSQDDVEITGRNCDNMEIYACSPSYLITAGGSPATYAIDPGPAGILAQGKVAQQLGVAVTTSFMPTSEYIVGAAQNARDIIQFSSFSEKPGEVVNYGVAPDFACGYKIYLPSWVPGITDREFLFIDRRYYGYNNIPGYYLAILKDGDFGLLEAFDTWLHPDVTFEQFKEGVVERNGHLVDGGLNSNVETQYTTHNGNRLTFVIWNNGEQIFAMYGAQVLRIEYGSGDAKDPTDSIGDAGSITDKFLNGTIMNSPAEGIVEITNPFLGTKITLEMSESDLWRPKRISETGEVEEAGSNHEVWVDFTWTGSNEGDFFHPFNSIAGAAAAVADGGVIKIMPGSTGERPSFHNDKRIRIVAPIGGVTIGVR